METEDDTDVSHGHHLHLFADCPERARRGRRQRRHVKSVSQSNTSITTCFNTSTTPGFVFFFKNVNIEGVET